MSTPTLSDAVTTRAKGANAAPNRPRGRFAWFRGLFLIVLGFVLWWTYRILFSTNEHTVLEGLIYRGAQLSPGQMERTIRDKKIRTVVNLRGPAYLSDWFQDQAAVCQEQGVAMEDLQFSATRAPSMREIRRLIEIIERAEKPIYFHCQRGADRTGLASALAMLLMSDNPHEQGRAQLGLWFGHLSFANTRWLDLFLDEYPPWLKETGKQHTKENFKHWLTEVAPRTGWWLYEETAFETLTEPKVGQPLVCKIRLKNTSRRPWKFDSLPEAGIHLGWHLWNEEGSPIDGGKGGVFRREVEPGGEIDLRFSISGESLIKPGKHKLFIDLIEEGNCWFFQAGAEPILKEIDVRE
ncbi:MAG: tyrosine-protein phosphatase [Gemmataceae bacterium]|nr:tyrosine-protein phosphatase [Gemmataceae bacterium]